MYRLGRKKDGRDISGGGGRGGKIEWIGVKIEDFSPLVKKKKNGHGRGRASYIYIVESPTVFFF